MCVVIWLVGGGLCLDSDWSNAACLKESQLFLDTECPKGSKDGLETLQIFVYNDTSNDNNYEVGKLH